MLLVLVVAITGCNMSDQRIIEGYTFNQEKGVVSVPQSDDFRGDITVDMFIKLHSYPSTWTSIVSKFTTDGNNEFNIRIKNQDTAQWYYGAGDRAFVLLWNPAKLLPLNEWVRLTAVRDIKKAKLSMFINGKEVVSRTFPQLPISAQSNSDIVLMGNNKFTINGAVAMLKIWKTPLNEEEIENTTVINKPTENDHLIGFWRFGNVKDGRVDDASKNKIDMVISKVK